MKNLGGTPIGWVEVSINTQEGFYEMWIVTINPGETKSITYPVQFTEADANVGKTLSVYAENDPSTPWADAHQDYSFTMASINVFSGIGDYAPMKEVYHPGDTVTIWISYRNEYGFDATDVSVAICLGTMERGIIFQTPFVESDVVKPGQTITASGSYTFTEDDVGTVLGGADLSYKMQGIEYATVDDGFFFNVEEREPDIGFTAALTADPAQIGPGDTVNFAIILKNTGGDDIDEYVVRSGEGGIIAATDGTAPGGTAHVTLDVPIYETGNISYVVVARAGGKTLSHETNRVTVTVTEPEASAEVSVSPEATAASPEYSAKPAPAPHPQPTPWSLRPSAAAAGAAAEPPAETDNTMLYIVLGAAALVIAGAVVVLVLALRKVCSK